ncbi:MAG: discoidin domain-containing protein, partial [Clostridiales bacterium]|nr:discoidin domain-containing protein [Clostridiales bacterium]
MINKKRTKVMAMVLTAAMVLTLAVFTSGATYNVQAVYGLQGYVELTGGLQFGATTVSGSQGRTTVNNHEYAAAVFGTGGWSSNGSYTFNNVDYRAAFDSAVGDGQTGASYFDGAKLGYAGIEFKTAQKVTQIALMPRQGYSTNRLVGAQFQGSDNGVNYTTLYTVSRVNTSGATNVSTADGLDASKAYKYYRLIGTSGMPDVFNIAEIKVYADANTGTGVGTGTGILAMPGYTELTGGLSFGGTTVSGSQGRTIVNNHPYVAAVFGTGGWSSSGYTFNNVDYRAAFDSKVGIWLP